MSATQVQNSSTLETCVVFTLFFGEKSSKYRPMGGAEFPSKKRPQKKKKP